MLRVVDAPHICQAAAWCGVAAVRRAVNTPSVTPGGHEERRPCSDNASATQLLWSANQSRKLRRFEFLTCHLVLKVALDDLRKRRSGSLVWSGCDRVTLAAVVAVGSVDHPADRDAEEVGGNRPFPAAGSSDRSCGSLGVGRRR
jgi:hypothetical protein